MEFPENLHYSKEHEWVASKNGESLVGVTAFAVEQLGDIVHVDLPEVGDTFESGDSFGSIESTKTVSDLYMPGTAKIVAVNKALTEEPESLQADPYEKGWLVKVEFAKECEDMLSSSEYEAYTKED